MHSPRIIVTKCTVPVGTASNVADLQNPHRILIGSSSPLPSEPSKRSMTLSTATKTASW